MRSNIIIVLFITIILTALGFANVCAFDSELLDILKKGVKEWNQTRKEYPTLKIDLENADLHEKNLQGVNFKAAKLGGVNFQGANLSEANLNYARLDNTKFQGANLQRVRFKEAWLYDTQFQGANLKNANLSGADGGYGKPNFEGANLENATICGMGGVNLKGANLKGVKYYPLLFNGAIFSSKTIRPNGKYASSLWAKSLNAKFIK